MGVHGDVESVGKAAFRRVAIGPILTGGQLTIAGMKLTTGLGEPEDGARFGEGGARLHGTAATLMSAQSTTDWSGTASALGLIPGVGAEAKAAADAHAVFAAVGRSARALEQLSAEVAANAAALQRLVGCYETVEQAANPSETNAVLAALKEDAERQAADDAKDDEAAGPGGHDTSQLAAPIAVTVESENLIGPPRAPGA